MTQGIQEKVQDIQKFKIKKSSTYPDNLTLH